MINYVFYYCSLENMPIDNYHNKKWLIITYGTSCIFVLGFSFRSVKSISTRTGLLYFTGAFNSILCKKSMSSPNGPETFGCADVGEFLKIYYNYTFIIIIILI